MKTMTKFLASAALLSAAAISATPAIAQVNGIATVDPTTVIAASQARNTAYQQISTTYSAQLQSAQQKQQQISQLGDTNGDGQLSQEERAAASNNSQIATLQSEIEQITAPVTMAEMYALELISQQFTAAQQQVISDKSISMILTPESIIYAPPEADVTRDVVTALNTRVPSVSTAVPAGWQPSRQTAQLHQGVQQILLISALQQRAQQQQQQQQNGTTQQPTGR